MSRAVGPRADAARSRPGEATTTAPAAPAATRSRRPGWRNPRLVLGLLLVAGSVVLGARLMGAADDSVSVWALARDLPSGATLAPGDLDRRKVRFADPATIGRYLAADRPPPDGATLGREVTAGELLPRAALDAATGPALVEVPVSVGADDLPATVRQGSHVDVWVTAKVAAASGARPTALAVLRDVVVVAVPRTEDTLAPQSTRQVIVGVPPERVGDLGRALGSMADGRVVIARRG